MENILSSLSSIKKFNWYDALAISGLSLFVMSVWRQEHFELTDPIFISFLMIGIGFGEKCTRSFQIGIGPGFTTRRPVRVFSLWGAIFYLMSALSLFSLVF